MREVNRWIERMPIVKKTHDVMAGNVIYKEKTAGKTNEKFFVPVGDDPREISVYAVFSRVCAQAAKEAEFLRMRVVDEDQPVYLDLLKWCDLGIEGGRISDARLLGMIGYDPACPQLIEAATHDTDKYMRAEAVKSVGLIGPKEQQYTDSVCNILMNDKEFWVREYAAKALGKLGNPAALPLLRNVMDEARSLVRHYEKEVYAKGRNDLRRELDRADMLVGSVASAIVYLDRQKNEIREMTSKETSGTVKHRLELVTIYGPIFLDL